MIRHRWTPLVVFFLVYLGAIALFAFGCAVTPKAAFRRDAESRLQSCLRTTPSPVARPRCYEEGERFCKDGGMEKRCSEGYQFLETPGFAR